MIPFKMQILNYNTSGSYSVEYIPDNEKCTPVKLDIRIDTSNISGPDEVVELLKKSSPQDFWNSEIGSSNIDHEELRKLVNTVHRVDSLGHANLAMGYTTPNPEFRRSIPTPTVSQAASPTVTNQADSPVEAAIPGFTSPGVEGYTLNQQVASRNEQQIIKLKVLIQQVIQEMAEGTV